MSEIFKICILLMSYSRICICQESNNTSNQIRYLKEIIEEGLANASTYTFPSNAEMYKPNDDKITAYGSYDFVIIGAGTTGAVIASRLSENKNFTVLVLEAGKWPKYGLFPFMALSFPSALSEYNWGFKSVRQTTACLGMNNEECSILQGRGVGGTTLINGAIYSHGDPKVFEKWAQMLKDPSWSYENVLKLYKKSENFVHRNPWAPVDTDFHGTGGPLNVEQSLPPDELAGVFLEANKKLGFKVADYNGPEQEMVSHFQLYTKNGKRHDTGTAFLKPILSRNNLKVLTESYVTRIEIDRLSKVAKGVTFTRQGKTYYANANKEVILSAGVFSSPRILMLSGIGPRGHLQEVGVDLIEDLDVGVSFIDDVINYSVPFSSNIYLPAQTFDEQLEDFLHGMGTLTSEPSSQGVGFYKSRINSVNDFVDLQLYCQKAAASSSLELKLTNWKNDTYEAIWEKNENSIQVIVFNLNPLSRGSVRLQSNNPFDYALIDYNLLSDRGNKDIDRLYEGIQMIFKLMKTAAFQRLGLKYKGKPLPGCQGHKFLSKDYWYCYLRQTSLPGYHATGSCPMGLDPKKGAVVDRTLNVYGVRRLRVADASVFPTTVARPPSATCIMIGEKIADVIKAQYK